MVWATTIFVCCVTAIVIVWDIIVAIEPTPGDTVSKVILRMSMDRPFVVQAAGFLCGHLFIPMRMTCSEADYWKVSLAIAGVLWAVITVLWHYKLLPRYSVGEWFMMFMVLGHFLFPQALE